MKLSLTPRSLLLSMTLALAAGAAFGCRKESRSAIDAPPSTYAQGHLGSYLGNATRANLWFARALETAPPRPGVVRELDTKQVKALLGRIDLKQTPNGPVSKCMGDYWYEFFDAQGNRLGRITFDGCAPRFDSTDRNVFGGIKADALTSKRD